MPYHDLTYPYHFSSFFSYNSVINTYIYKPPPIDFNVLSVWYFLKNVATSLNHPQNQCSLRASWKIHSLNTYWCEFSARIQQIHFCWKQIKNEDSKDFMIFSNWSIFKMLEFTAGQEFPRTLYHIFTHSTSVFNTSGHSGGKFGCCKCVINLPKIGLSSWILSLAKGNVEVQNIHLYKFSNWATVMTVLSADITSTYSNWGHLTSAAARQEREIVHKIS